MITEDQKKIISVVSKIERRYISDVASGWNERRITTKKGFVKTEYYAMKRAAQIAMNVFCRSEWPDVTLRIYNEDKGGYFFTIKIERNAFFDFFNIEAAEIKNAGYMNEAFWQGKYDRNDVLRFATHFTD